MNARARGVRRPQNTRDRQYNTRDRQYYEHLYRHLSVCMFAVDVTRNGRFRYVGFNPAEEKAIGLSTEQVAGKFVEDVFAPELARKLIENYRRCLEAGNPITYDDELNLPGGSRLFHSNLIPFRNRAGRIHRIVGACVDKTDLQRTQDAAISSHKLQSLGVMTACVAHDLNNLLGSILALGDLGETELATGSSPENELREIRAVATNGTQLLEALMTYVRQGSTTRQPIDVSLMVQESAQLFRLFMSKRADLRISVPQKPAIVHANPAQLRQVILNLLTNASEALGDTTGVICVSVMEIPGNTAGDSTDNGANPAWIRLMITDSGDGMTAEVLSKIFDPLYTTKSSGRGLGLAIVQEIVRRHDGAISARSVPGQGSEFEILLPSSASMRPARPERTADQ